MNADRTLPWDWHSGRIPENVMLGEDAYIETSYSFELSRATQPGAIRLGRAAAVYSGVLLDVGAAGRVTIGDYALLNGGLIISDALVEIGDYSLISWNVVLMDSYRLPFSRELRAAALRNGWKGERAEGAAEARPIRIGRNVWIGFDTCVLPGVSIGEGSIVGARSVVSEDVPAFTIAAGNPARVIRAVSPGKGGGA